MVLLRVICGLKRITCTGGASKLLYIAIHTYILAARVAMQRNNWCLAPVIVDMKTLAAKIMKAGLLLPLSGLGLLLAGGPAAAASVGEFAPEFEIATQDGAVFRLSDFRGRKPVYVVFWNSWCSYCIKKTPRYIKLQE